MSFIMLAKTTFGAVSVLFFALAVVASNGVTLPLPQTPYWPLRLLVELTRVAVIAVLFHLKPALAVDTLCMYTTLILNLCLLGVSSILPPSTSHTNGAGKALITGVLQAIATTPATLTLFVLTTGGGIVLSYAAALLAVLCRQGVEDGRIRDIRWPLKHMQATTEIVSAPSISQQIIVRTASEKEGRNGVFFNEEKDLEWWELSRNYPNPLFRGMVVSFQRVAID
ncbi:hypothetical protein DFH06DRAFT_1444339 [Mycena polygramma]|nr:hypothetical protein DFH06DRAFT_1444339 [Mycena polygramma]